MGRTPATAVEAAAGCPGVAGGAGPGRRLLAHPPGLGPGAEGRVRVGEAALSPRRRLSPRGAPAGASPEGGEPPRELGSRAIQQQEPGPELQTSPRKASQGNRQGGEPDAIDSPFTEAPASGRKDLKCNDLIMGGALPSKEEANERIRPPSETPHPSLARHPRPSVTPAGQAAARPHSHLLAAWVTLQPSGTEASRTQILWNLGAAVPTKHQGAWLQIQRNQAGPWLSCTPLSPPPHQAAWHANEDPSA